MAEETHDLAEPGPKDLSAGQAFWGGVQCGCGLPGVIMGASFLGFGSLVQSADHGLWVGLVSTATGWALPGQVVGIELHATGASLVTVGLAIFLANLRLLPLVLTLQPSLNQSCVHRWRHFVHAHLIAVTTWVISRRRFPELEPSARLPFFLGFGITLWHISLAGTAVGYALADLMPTPVTLGLVFLNPLYFSLLLIGDLVGRLRVLAIGLGAVTGPPLILMLGDWGLLLAGVAAGSLAVLLSRRPARTRASQAAGRG